MFPSEHRVYCVAVAFKWNCISCSSSCSLSLSPIDSSVNGSPVEQYDPGEVVITAKKQRRFGGNNHNAKTPAPFPVTIGIGAGNGECIDLSDPNQRRKLDGEQKAQAMQQLMAMQEQMKHLMDEW